MTTKSIFEFDDYKAYLAYLEQERSHFTRGFRSQLAKEAGCNNAFISQVLNTGAHFSLEQGLRLSKHFNLKSDEERYFLNLIAHARSGTEDLRNHFKKLLNDLKEKNLNIKERVKQQTALTLEAQSTYYSQWYYSAVHILVTIPKFRTIPEIAKALKLSHTLVEKTVTFLLSCGLLVEKKGELLSGPMHLHLERTSPYISKHHTNWRIQAISSLQKENKSDIHYSTVSSLSLKDIEILKAKLVQVIQDYTETVSRSKEEALYCLNVDFFDLTE